MRAASEIRDDIGVVEAQLGRLRRELCQAEESEGTHSEPAQCVCHCEICRFRRLVTFVVPPGAIWTANPPQDA